LNLGSLTLLSDQEEEILPLQRRPDLLPLELRNRPAHQPSDNESVGHWGAPQALETREIYRAKLLLGSIYRAQLAAELQKRLGLEIEPREVGFHIKGVPLEVCDA
jgi:hypothetical protein